MKRNDLENVCPRVATDLRSWISQVLRLQRLEIYMIHIEVDDGDGLSKLLGPPVNQTIEIRVRLPFLLLSFL